MRCTDVVPATRVGDFLIFAAVKLMERSCWAVASALTEATRTLLRSVLFLFFYRHAVHPPAFYALQM